MAWAVARGPTCAPALAPTPTAAPARAMKQEDPAEKPARAPAATSPASTDGISAESSWPNPFEDATGAHVSGQSCENMVTKIMSMGHEG